MRFNEIVDPNMISNAPEHHRRIASNYGLLMNPTVIRAFEFMEMVKRDCQPYLQQVDNDPTEKYSLYRGILATKKPYITKRVRLQDRKPKDLPFELHEEINKYFTKHYGAPFRNALFATSDMDQAGEYAYGGAEGELYLIFPVGKFEFLWSPQVDDMLNKVFEYDLTSLDITDEDDQEQLLAFSEQVLSTYQTTDLKAAIKSGHEVSIRCERYHALITEKNWPLAYYSAFGELLNS